jgi:ADYC domain
MRFVLFLIVLGLIGFPAINPVAAVTAQLTVEGVNFVLQLSDGRSLRGENLVGLKIMLRHEGQDVEVRIDQVDKDEEAVGGPVTLYHMSVLDPSSGAPRDLCQPDVLGRKVGLPLSQAEGFGFTCTSGAEGKCVLMGYRPWEEPKNGVFPSDLHRACVHAMRADYGGDNRPSTKDGTLVNVYDRFGIRTPAETSGMEFEAAWGADGAICVAHPRIADNVSLEQLAEHYPRLKGRLGPQACTEDAMRTDPQALLFNESLVTSRSTP